MSSSLSSLIDKLSEGLHNYKCTNCKSCLITYQLNTQNVAKTIKSILINI